MSIFKYYSLYKKDTTGKIRIWYMEQDDDKYRTVSGLVNGKLVYSEWTIALPKCVGHINERNGTVQAREEILSKYKKQEKTGYVDEDAYKAGVFDSAFTKIKPMLAHNYKDRKKDVIFDGTWGIQTKLNGARCIITKDGMFTRKNEQFVSCPHIFESLKPFFSAFPNSVLDGELFNESYRQKLNEIMSLIRKTKNITKEDLEKSEKIVRFYFYDFYDTNDYPMNMEYYARILAGRVRVKSHGGQYINLVETYFPSSEDDAIKFFNDRVAEGHEGIILRNLNGSYEQTRSKNLLKYKPMDDAECTILDIKEGDGNWAGVAKVITVQWQDKVFDITFKGTMDDAAQMMEDFDTWIGKEVTFEYYGLTGLGTPNFGQLNYRNCLKS